MRNTLTTALTALVLMIGIVGCGNSHGWSEVSEDDPRIVAAREKARETFPDFIKAFKSRKAGDIFTVEVYYQGAEYIQLQVLKASDSEITGTVDCYPENVSLQRGEMVTVQLTDMNTLSDWAIYDAEGESQGGFVAEERAILERGSSGG